MAATKQLYHSLSNFTPTPPQDPNPRHLCKTLFRQLDADLRQFFYALHHDPHPHSRLRPIAQALTLTLRCSLVVLTLPHSDQNLLLRNSRFLLLRVLKPVLSVVATTTTLRLLNPFTDAHIHLPESCRPFLCSVLEVFADELLRHQSLRRFLMVADSTSSASEKLFMRRFNCHDDIVCVLEVMCSHFVLSHEKGFENFISGLFLHCDNECFRFPELRLAPAVALLLDPAVHSAPKMFRAHAISLVSDAIGSGLSSEILGSDIGCHLIAFQKSVTLYSMHVSSLQIDGFYVKPNCAYDSYLLERSYPSFESYVQEGTMKRLNQVLSESNNSWESYHCIVSSRAKDEFLAEYIAFVKGRLCIFADSCRDMAASILDSIIRRGFSQDAVVCIKENTSAEDIFLLVSILKLMSVTLLQAVKCLSNDGGDSGCLKTMGSSSLRDQYDFLISVLNDFQQCKFCLPFQTFLCDVMKSQQTDCKVSKSMLVHFSGLLSLSFSYGLDLLAKGCISVIMALMCLFVFEEGDLVALGSLRVLPLQSCSSEISSDKNGEDTVDKKSAYKIAAEFHRIQTCNLRTEFNLVEDRTEKTSSGEMFLNCILEDPKKLSDYDELADFLECEPGKNYASWLKGRAKIRKWRYKKMLNLRKGKKEKIWRSLKRRKI
ncbi:uncharacterized protein LOC130720097 [Lotus japonicus]|uniref:uncharacterized protein LOC130720097 n=1 Tax=Lotus japonicus TaxID=34305 RepID=UPI0025857986|nr:uncharacterized protein LOC130720097 [Lotus japonicus]